MYNEYTKLFKSDAELVVVYADCAGELTERAVRVLYRYTSQAGDVVAKVHCYRRNATRDLRLDRVMWAAPYALCTPACSVVPPGFEYDVLTAVA